MDDISALIGQTLDQYRIIEQVGQGGMATVFKAYQPGLNRDVALKVLPPHFAVQAGFTERFMREAQAIGNLNHPNILPVHDSGQDKGYSYIVMRYVPDARTLSNEMKAPLKTERIIELMSQIAGALDQAHKAGIIHRDVKPSNILLDEQWSLLSDFGLAKMVEGSSDLTGTGVGMGTPAYMSPEQGMGKKVDHKTDIYALGIILYEMLTGQVPHRAETPMATVLKRINEPLPLPRNLNPNIPEAVERVLLKVLAPDPEQRFDSAGEMATTLKAAFGSSPDEVLIDVLPMPTVATQTAAAPAEPTRISTQAEVSTAKGKSGLPLSLFGFAFVGLLLCLILGGIGFLILRQPGEDTDKLALTAIAQNAEAISKSDQESSSSSAPADTPTPISSDTPVPTDTPRPTDTPIPTDTPQPTDTAIPPTDTPAVAPPTDTPTAAPPTVAPLTSEPLTGQEVYDMALTQATQWQADAVLSEIGTSSLGPLDAEGKSTSWMLKFWSPSSKGFNSMFFMEGNLSATPSDLPVPKAVVAENVILDTKQLYDIAEVAGAASYTAEGYRPSAALIPYPLDESRLTWYLNYAGGDYRVVYTVIIDAVSGELIQAIDLE